MTFQLRLGPGVGALAVSLALAFTPSAFAAKASVIRIGVINAQTGPSAALGAEENRGIAIALAQLGNKIDGIPVEMHYEDAVGPTEIGLRKVTKLIEEDKIEFLLGNQFSNQLLAYMPLAARNHVFVLSGVAGPSRLAGKDCNPYLFVLSWENNTPSAAAGALMNDMGVKRGYFIGQNYVTGKEHVAGAKRFFKGTVVGEAYVPPSQVDFAAEIANMRAANPQGLYVFLPGASGIAFLKQFENSGLKGKIKLFSGSWLADETNFAALGDAALGHNLVANWFASLDNPANTKFVDAFRKKYGRPPVLYAAFLYDSVMLLNAAVTSLGGDISNPAALRAAFEQAKIHSVRGNFAFNVNHFPIQNFYSATVVKVDGVLQHKVTGTIFTNYKDSFYGACHMPG